MLCAAGFVGVRVPGPGRVGLHAVGDATPTSPCYSPKNVPGAERDGHSLARQFEWSSVQSSGGGSPDGLRQTSKNALLLLMPHGAVGTGRSMSRALDGPMRVQWTLHSRWGTPPCLATPAELKGAHRQGCIGRGGGPPPPPFQGTQPMPSHYLPNAKCQTQWHF